MKTPVHIVAAGALVTRGDEVLIQYSDRRGWEFPGGQVEQGESIIDGLLREIEEETGVTARVTAFVGVYSNLTQKQGYGPLQGTLLPPIVNMDFLCEYISGEIRPSDESVKVEWVSRAEALRRVTHPVYVRRLQKMLNYDGDTVFCSFRKENTGQTEWIDEVILKK